MSDDARERVAKAMMGQLPPSIADMRDYINRTPYLAEMNKGQSIVQPMQPGRSILPEAAAMADPFGIMQLQRLFGFDVNPMARLNESHGLARKEDERIHELLMGRGR